MKRKIIGILVCTLLISATGIAIADWDVGEEFKMHHPQLPDPYGFDVDWGWGPLGDDWLCTETGNVDDIHFWLSWFYDIPLDIPFIDVSIWSNNPVGPHGWSEPLDMLWQERFYPGQFVMRHYGDGDQLWMLPDGSIINVPHFGIYQINIIDIINPFEQIEGEIYWLVIDMPWAYELTVGWKTSLDYFMDHPVWQDPTGMWIMIDGIEFAFVITGGPEPCDPSIDIEKYVWDEKNKDWVDADTMAEALDVPICENVKFQIVVHNNGICPLYYINISDHMHDSLKFISADPEPGDVWYDSTAEEWRMWWYFPGPLNPCNKIVINLTAHVEGPECSSDYNWVHVGALCEHGVYVEDEDECWVHAYKKSREINRPFLQFLQNHPNLFPILRLLLQRLGLQ